MTDAFASQQTDLQALYMDPAAGMYRDSGAPTQEPAGADKLYAQAQTALAPAQPGATPPAQPTVSANSTQNPSPDSGAVVARFKPLGITSLDQLRGKSDAELRSLSGQAVAFELRQQALSKSFARLPDGGWDFTKGPDGTPTGLGPDGKALPPAGATPAPGAKPVPAPAPAPEPAPKPSGAKPAPAKKPVAKKPAAKKTVVRQASKKPAAKPAPKKPAAPVIRHATGRGALV